MKFFYFISILPTVFSHCIVPDLTRVGNGVCDTGIYNTEECLWDGGDCCPHTSFCLDPNFEHSFSFMLEDCVVEYPEWIGDNICDGPEYNNENCNWDGGDCCPCSCTNCYANVHSCLDPGYFDICGPGTLSYSLDIEACNSSGGYSEGVENGYCEIDNYTEECNYDGSDCSFSFSYPFDIHDCYNKGGYPGSLGDGYCQSENYRSICAYDGGDCDELSRTVSFDIELCVKNGGHLHNIGDYYCDSDNYIEECGFDIGDCSFSFDFDIALCASNGGYLSLIHI